MARMSYIENSLSTGEEVVAVFPIHWLYWAIMVFWSLLGSCILIGVSALISYKISLIMLLLCLLVVGYYFMKFRGIERGVTNKRVITKHGIVARISDEMKLTSIETVEINQSFWDRLFNCGTVRITGRGESVLLLNQVDDPLFVKKTIESINPEN